MPSQLFLSHDARDRAQAEVVARAIGRISLGQIGVWYSSDGTGSGGIQVGQVWIDEIRAKLKSSRAVVVLLTPLSIARPWVLFESGFGAAQDGCDVIPVCIGIDSATEVPFPLAMYQTFQLSDYESLKRFVSKLFARYDVRFDEEMAQSVLREAVSQLIKGSEARTPPGATATSISDAVAELKAHVDRRLMSLVNERGTASGGSRPHRYNVEVELNVDPDQSNRQFLEIGPAQTVQDVLDNVYFMLEGKVQARTYLEEWLLRDVDKREHLVIREMQYRIPAQSIFAPGTRWEVIFLPRPYTATDHLSRFPVRPKRNGGA